MTVQLTGIPALLSVKGRLNAGVQGVLFAFVEFELQLADHEPVV